MSSLSLIVPMRDEARRLPLHLPRLLRWCRRRHAELVICDDGSRDGTLELALSMASQAKVPAQGLALPRRGKGAAVSAGLQAAHGDILAMVDADVPLPVSDLDLVVARIARGAQMSIGVRPTGTLRSGPSPVRQILSMASRQLSRILLGGIEDSQCGCKAWTADAARRLCTGRIIDGFAFDFEFLTMARRLGLAIATVPVNWSHREGSHVRPLPDAMRFLYDLVRIFGAHRSRAP